jgi:RNA polymerase sigma factor (sigma-70 family)
MFADCSWLTEIDGDNMEQRFLTVGVQHSFTPLLPQCGLQPRFLHSDVNEANGLLVEAKHVNSSKKLLTTLHLTLTPNSQQNLMQHANPPTAMLDFGTSSTSTDGHSAQDAEAAMFQELLAQVVAKNQTAFKQLYDTTINRVFALVSRIVRNDALAEEAVSDAYMQVWRDASKHDASRGVVIAWILMIARSRALDLLRRQDDWAVSTDPEILQTLAQQDATGESWVAAELPPDEWLEMAQTQTVLATAMQQLKPVQRQLLALAFFRGMSHQEIAETSGLALGTVKTHIRRALNKLKTLVPELAD